MTRACSRPGHRRSDKETVPIPELEPLPSDLRGRCAVVTGAARGIGLGIVQHLIRAGSQVVAIDKDGVALKEAVSGVAICIEHDLALEDDDSGSAPIPNGEALASKVLALTVGQGLSIPSLIVNNAGIDTPHSFRELESGAFDHVHRVNVRTPVHLTRTLVKAFLHEREKRPTTASRRGAVLFISSVHADVPSYRPHYGASKAAIETLAREIALELGPHGIRVNVISPGWIRTDPNPTNPEQRAKVRAMTPWIPLGRPGTPDDVARLALLLLSDQWSGYVTGANLRVDGGLSLNTWMPPPGSRWTHPDDQAG